MSHRKFTIEVESVESGGHGWRVIVPGKVAGLPPLEVDSGFVAGSKRDARRAARASLEQLGLITDGVDCNV